MRVLLLFLVAWIGATAPCLASQTRPGDASRAHYTIAAKVDSANRRLEGELTLGWRNGTDRPTSELWFHLHHNAYANNRTTHLEESGGKLRGVTIKAGWGWQKVTRFEFEGLDLTQQIEMLAPEPESEGATVDDSGDRTIFRVRLPREVGAGEEIRVRLTWESLIPRVRRRTGIKEEFVMMAHWFPKLGVFEGQRGWNCHRFHANSEFYADYGTYDVTLDLPENYAEGPDAKGQWIAKVGASGGMAAPPKVEQGRLIVRFLAPTQADRDRMDPVTGSSPVVHGFAWTADPGFRMHEKRFVFAEWAERYHTEVQAAAIAFRKPLDQIQLRDVDVRVLVQPEHEDQWERHFEATAAALFFYGLWWGEYPYEAVTVVDPAFGASGAGGMEYPTLFTAGTSRFTSPSMYSPESVTVHEAGHQFWYGLVGNNEYENAWMDEGFNSYTDSEVLWRHYGAERAFTRYSSLPIWGERAAALPTSQGLGGMLSGQHWRLPRPFGFRWLPKTVWKPSDVSPFVAWYRDQPLLTFLDRLDDPRWGDRSGYLRDADVDPIATMSFLYRDNNSYRTNSYPRTAVVLRSLAGVVGQDAFLRGMRFYADQWRYRHPYPTDFYSAFQEGAEVEIPWYFEELFEGTGTVDWSVEVADQVSTEAKGWFLGDDGEWREANAKLVPVEPQVSEAPAPANAVDAPRAPEVFQDTPKPRRQRVVVNRKGTLRLPLTIFVRYTDQTEKTFVWTREAQKEHTWWELPLAESSLEIDAVVLDPQRLYYLDGNMSDNQWYRPTHSHRSLRFGERVFTQYTHLLHFFTTLGG